ncbi:hypothetical protein D0868_00336 [Hortaea werneckii]|uniref:Amino acid permease/ SLC12A domain-containing protein n=1 Tax=Hortaea werneckii TaxID=91943 RepID=A0A3M6ZMK7_HORWE|nr:hypothetical protein D0868_00336 [Hortaea werneckii]
MESSGPSYQAHGAPHLRPTFQRADTETIAMDDQKGVNFSIKGADDSITPPRGNSDDNFHAYDDHTVDDKENGGVLHTIGGGSASRSGPMDRLDRYLSSKPIISFGLTLQASWEAIAISFQSTLQNGGPSTLVYGCILSTFGSAAMAATLGELASMKPCVGAQYRWSALLAPRGTNPRFWGYLQGWLTTFAWNAACALNPYLMGSMLQGCIILCREDYIPQGWHTTLLAYASMALPIVCNIYARRIIAPLEIAAAILHVLLLIVFVVVLTVMARRSTADFVFQTSFFGISGWDSPGIEWSIGLLAVIFPMGGYDSILHMADEVKDAPRKVPQAMWGATVLSGIVGFIFIVVLMFCLGDVDKVSNSPTGLPIIETLYEATGSKAGTVFMVMCIYFIIASSQFNILASVSRLAWAFAKDGGLPFSKQLSKVHPTLRIPVNAVLVTSTICLLINIIPVGSTTAFYALTSLSTLALYFSYCVPATLILIRKLENNFPPYGPWKIGGPAWVGLAVNVFGFAWGWYCVFSLCLPTVMPVTAANMNWAGPILGAVICIGLSTWFLGGSENFQLPADEVE